MKTQVRLNPYERGIAEALAGGFGYSAADARSLVIRKLGAYDNCRDHAERIAEAHGKVIRWRTLQLIGEYIKRKFGESYSIRGVSKLMHRLNMSYTSC